MQIQVEYINGLTDDNVNYFNNHYRWFVTHLILRIDDSFRREKTAFTLLVSGGDGTCCPWALNHFVVWIVQSRCQIRINIWCDGVRNVAANEHKGTVVSTEWATNDNQQSGHHGIGLVNSHGRYRKVSNIKRTKFQNFSDSRPALQLSLPNLLKPCIKSRMKM